MYPESWLSAFMWPLGLKSWKCARMSGRAVRRGTMPRAKSAKSAKFRVMHFADFADLALVYFPGPAPVREVRLHAVPFAANARAVERADRVARDAVLQFFFGDVRVVGHGVASAGQNDRGKRGRAQGVANVMQ